jgi:cation-transporting P-type ATPase E
LVLVAILALTIGAVKISLKQTLIQRVNAVESLANVTVLCFDKTGTLTQNKLAVTDILPVNGFSADSITHKLQHYTRSLSYQNRTAGAVAVFVSKVGLLPDGVSKVREIPFTSSRKWGAVQFPDETLILGAPERMVKDPSVLQKTTELSSQGLRILAFARSAKPLPDTNYLNDHCETLALIVMSDQIRHDIGVTLEDFRQLNVDLKVVSGDNLETVRAIAGDAGMPVDKAYTGDQLNSMDDNELEHAVMDASVFARIEPETKRRIVQALQRREQYVAMVGDGVNDVPALKAANLAIVMNDGTQISKDVADIVLLNNAMSTLPLAFREGREITQTVFGTMKMFLTKNFYNVLLFVFVGFMMMPFPITPAQISWAAFGTVNMPATFIAFGWLRPKYIASFRRDAMDYMVTAGMIGAVAIAVLFAITYFSTGYDLEITRSSITIFICLFGTVIVWNVQGVEILNPKSFGQHKWVVIISSIATTLTLISFYMFPKLFEFQPPTDFRLIALITSLFLLTLVMVDYSMRYRFLLSQLWMLVEREK